MRMPEGLAGLLEYGLIDEVIRPLMSGKEAQIYLVYSQGEERVAKVYREAEHRNFKHRAEYTEGRNTRNSRDQRARAKRTRYGRGQDEAAWRSTEVDMIYRLNDAGVRVPRPYHFVDGVLIMELVKDAEGEPAPRLGDLDLDPDEAAKVYEHLLGEVIRMLAAGVVHGDLSDFNVLVDADGPVIIDLPQAIDASANSNARRLLLRDVENLHNFAKRSMPGLRPKPYAQEMWELFQRGDLTAETKLRGQFKAADKRVNTDDVLGLVREADDDEQRRREALGLPPAGRGRRVEVVMAPPAGGNERSRGGQQQRGGQQPRGGQQQRGGQQPRGGQAQQPRDGQQQGRGGQQQARPPHTQAGAQVQDAEAPRRRRRRRRRGGQGPEGATDSVGGAQTAQQAGGGARPPARSPQPQPQATQPTPTAQAAQAGEGAEGAPRARRRRRRRRPAAPSDQTP